jgi:hypothetical protein
MGEIRAGLSLPSMDSRLTTRLVSEHFELPGRA